MNKNEIIETQRNVLRLLDKYLAAQKQDELWAADGGMMTVEELREHINGTLKLGGGLTKRAAVFSQAGAKSARSRGSKSKVSRPAKSR